MVATVDRNLETLRNPNHILLLMNWKPGRSGWELQSGKAECALGGRGSGLVQVLEVMSICWKGHPQGVCLPGLSITKVLKPPYSPILGAMCSALAILRLSCNL